MTIEQYILDAIEIIGGIYQNVDYNLYQVILPDTYADMFQDRIEFIISFDAEVAQENDGCELVGFGSSFFDAINSIVKKETLGRLFLADVEVNEIMNAEQKIKNFLDIGRGNINIINSEATLCMWGRVYCNLKLITDQKIEKILDVWVNCQNNQVDTSLSHNKNWLFEREDAEFNYKVACIPDIKLMLKAAIDYIGIEASKLEKELLNPKVLEQNVVQVKSYYDDLMAENEKRMKRKNITEEKLSELASKAKALEIEKNKKVEDIYYKLSVQKEIILQYIITYAIPCMKYSISVVNRSLVENRVVYYNPIGKYFFE